MSVIKCQMGLKGRGMVAHEVCLCSCMGNLRMKSGGSSWDPAEACRWATFKRLKDAG